MSELKRKEFKEDFEILKKYQKNIKEKLKPHYLSQIHLESINIKSKLF